MKSRFNLTHHCARVQEIRAMTLPNRRQCGVNSFDRSRHTFKSSWAKQIEVRQQATHTIPPSIVYSHGRHFVVTIVTLLEGQCKSCNLCSDHVSLGAWQYHLCRFPLFGLPTSYFAAHLAITKARESHTATICRACSKYFLNRRISKTCTRWYWISSSKMQSQGDIFSNENW